MSAAEQPDEVRVVKLKPGDVLAIGNVGDISEEGAAAIATMRDAIGLRSVWLFADDITLDVIHATTPDTPDPGDGGADGGRPT